MHPFSDSPFPSDPSFHRLIDEGGDWDRRNRLKVYNGLHLLSIRQFKRGGKLLRCPQHIHSHGVAELQRVCGLDGYCEYLGRSKLSRCDRFKSLSRVSSVIPMIPFMGVLKITESILRKFAFHETLTESRVTCWPKTRSYSCWPALQPPSQPYSLNTISQVEHHLIFKESISPLASTVMNLVKSPSIAAAEI